MGNLKRFAIKGALAAILAGGALAGATAASAEIACNSAGDCWHVRHHLSYPAEAGVVFHDDAWRATHWDPSFHWRGEEGDGRGYYRGGVWIGF